MAATASDGKSGATSFFTSSLSCAKKYCYDEGTSRKQLGFFWTNLAKSVPVDVMELAHQQGSPLFGIILYWFVHMRRSIQVQQL